MTRIDHPRLCWLTEHLADVVLFGFTTPIAIAALILNLT